MADEAPVLSASAKRRQRAKRLKERSDAAADEDGPEEVATTTPVKQEGNATAATPAKQQQDRRKPAGGCNDVGIDRAATSGKQQMTPDTKSSPQCNNSRKIMLNRMTSDVVKVGTVVEPETGHTASVILLHGLGDKSSYWAPFYEAMKAVGVRLSGIRWIALDAPKRIVYDERTSAWFQYYTDRCGQDVEDDINEGHLESCRAELQEVVKNELQRMIDAGASEPKVLLAGSSQGGSMALDVGLNLRAGGGIYIAGVAMLRSLALGATARATTGTQKSSAPLRVLAVSGDKDETFDLGLVRKQLDKVCRGNRGAATKVEHTVVAGLDHDTAYNVKETLEFLKFAVDVLGLEVSKDGSMSEAAVSAVLPDEPEDPSNKAWADLTEFQQQLAKQLGIRTAKAWDDGTAAVWELPWNKLSTLQRTAAKSLGFMERTWDDEDEDDIAAEKSWAALTDVERKLAQQLGVTGANAWDNGTAPIWSKAWRKLTPAQKKAAVSLGFEEAAWGKS